MWSRTSVPVRSLFKEIPLQVIIEKSLLACTPEEFKTEAGSEYTCQGGEGSFVVQRADGSFVCQTPEGSFVCPRPEGSFMCQAPEGPFVCDFCKKKYKHKRTLMTHKKYECENSQTISGPHICDSCGKTYKHRRNLCAHKKYDCDFGNLRQRIQKYHSCEKCGKVYKQKQHLKRHIIYECDGIPRFFCKICDKRFRHGKRLFDCDSCGRSYKNKHHLVRHKRYECGVEAQFPCQFCHLKFKHNSSLKIHIGHKHLAGAKWPNVCASCGRIYKYKGDLSRHQRYECGVEPKFKCDVCHKRFKRKTNLKVHVVRHYYEAGKEGYNVGTVKKQ
ncbi:unnamed protein product [Nezara viridula]|uniref:C2H2-type domain-containing protein n=1 Tax=Nezara viridula TaxID=85310 RepID=A0A9P0MGK8_NEZVI|nr:unnamed protein product [Nezara viridula]